MLSSSTELWSSQPKGFDSSSTLDNDVDYLSYDDGDDFSSDTLNDDIDDDAMMAKELQLLEVETLPEDGTHSTTDPIATQEDGTLLRDDNDDDDDESPSWLIEWRTWIQAAEQCRTNLESKQKSLHRELEKAQSVEATVQRATLLTSHLYLFTPGIKSATVQDWETGQTLELTLNPSYESASQEVDALFQQARKLKRGSHKIVELLEETARAVQILDDILHDVSSLETENEVTLRWLQDKLRKSSRVTTFVAPAPNPLSAPGSSPKQPRPSRHSKQTSTTLGSPASNIRKLTTPAGCTILVGRNRRGNEYLSLSLAKGNDVWLHARSTPGAHVLLPQRRGSVPYTPECLQLAANVAIFYSDARSERRAPVTVASPKHIVKPRHAPLGAVQLRQEDQVIVGIPADVPDELKQARDESGFGDEYRAADKAKHRKKTATAASTAKAKAAKNRKKSASGRK